MRITVRELKALLRETNELENYKYYHLSSKNLGSEFTFTPRLPRFPYEDDNGDVIEDDFTPRVSWATSIDNALKALTPNNIGKFYVYATNNLPGRVDVAASSENGPSSPGNDYGPDFTLKKYINWATENDVEVHRKGKTIVDVEDCVPDAEQTHEQWATEPVNARQVGIIYNSRRTGWTPINDDVDWKY